MAVVRTAEATWSGDLLGGSGTIESVGSGTFGPLRVTWKARAEGAEGLSSPEELLAAAHAACFSMALANVLAKAGSPPESLSTVARVTFVGGTGITRSELVVEGTVSGMDEAAFQRAAEDAKENCPVSKALAGNVELAVSARLNSAGD
jgi:osmotically inducible protein OsmC